jgi:hypothetical protein
MGFAATPNPQLRCALALLSCLSMLLFHSGRTVDSQLLSCALALTNL